MIALGAPCHETDLSFDLLFVCRGCCGIYGEIDWTVRGRFCPSLRQQCDCRPFVQSSPWPSFDFPQAVTLCRCCGRKALSSGSRWSLWFCAGCIPGVKAINRLYGQALIPANRYSIIAHALTLTDDDDADTCAATAVPNDWFDRVELLEAHALGVVECNLDKLRGVLANEVKLTDYLREAASLELRSSDSLIALGRTFGLPTRLLLDAARSLETNPD